MRRTGIAAAWVGLLASLPVATGQEPRSVDIREAADAIRRRLDACTLRAPIDGTLHHDRMDGAAIREGHIIPEGTRLFRIAPED